MKRLLSPLIELLPDWITEPFQSKTFILLSATTSYVSVVSGLFEPWVNIIVLMILGWCITVVFALYEHHTRLEKNKEPKGMWGKIGIYTFFVVGVMFLYVLDKNSGSPLGSITSSMIFGLFLLMLLGEAKRIRKNYNLKYKQKFDLRWLDRISDMIEKKWIEDVCKIEPLDEDEDPPIDQG